MCLSYQLLSMEQLAVWANKDFQTLNESIRTTLPIELEAFSWLAELRLKQLEQDENYANWSLRLIYLQDEVLDKVKIVGLIGFHSPPNPNYLKPIIYNAIELGYHIIKSERRKGFASQAIQDMMLLASQSQVDYTVLSIAFANEASLSLAKKLSFNHYDNPKLYIEKHESVFYKANNLSATNTSPQHPQD